MKKSELGAGSQLAQHTNFMVSNLKMGLLAATKEFKQTLEMRSSKMKDQQQRKVSLTGDSALSPSQMTKAAAGRSGGSNSNSSSSSSRRSSSSSSGSFGGPPRPGANFDSAPKGPLTAPKSARPFGLPNPYDLAGGSYGGKDKRAYGNMASNGEADQDDGESSPLHGGGAGYAQNHNVGGLGGQEQRLLLAPPTQSRCIPPPICAILPPTTTVHWTASCYNA